MTMIPITRLSPPHLYASHQSELEFCMSKTVFWSLWIVLRPVGLYWSDWLLSHTALFPSLRPLLFLPPKTIKLFGFQGSERTWWIFSQKRIVAIKFDIYVCLILGWYSVWFNATFRQYFSYFIADCFVGGRDRTTNRKNI
jgi:hypothetical protein